MTGVCPPTKSETVKRAISSKNESVDNMDTSSSAFSCFSHSLQAVATNMRTGWSIGVKYIASFIYSKGRSWNAPSLLVTNDAAMPVLYSLYTDVFDRRRNERNGSNTPIDRFIWARLWYLQQLREYYIHPNIARLFCSAFERQPHWPIDHSLARSRCLMHTIVLIQVIEWPHKRK